jgi:hypothetical protein
MTDKDMEQILALPVVCLETANFDFRLEDIVQGQNTVIGT